MDHRRITDRAEHHRQMIEMDRQTQHRTKRLEALRAEVRMKSKIQVVLNAERSTLVSLSQDRECKLHEALSAVSHLQTALCKSKHVASLAVAALRESLAQASQKCEELLQERDVLSSLRTERCTDVQDAVRKSAALEAEISPCPNHLIAQIQTMMFKLRATRCRDIA